MVRPRNELDTGRRDPGRSRFDGCSKLQRLRADHEPAVLAFEQTNRAYFAESISDRGDDFFEHFAVRYRALLAEQETGACVFHVLLDEDEEVVGRFNLYDLVDGTARLVIALHKFAGSAISDQRIRVVRGRAAQTAGRSFVLENGGVGWLVEYPCPRLGRLGAKLA